MNINYETILTIEQKVSILEARIQQFASERYQYELSLKTAEKLGSEEQIQQIKNILYSIDVALEVHKEELSLLMS